MVCVASGLIDILAVALAAVMVFAVRHSALVLLELATVACLRSVRVVEHVEVDPEKGMGHHFS